MKPAEAALLAYAQAQGPLTLLLRRDGDREFTLPPAVDSRNALQIIERLARERAGR